MQKALGHWHQVHFRTSVRVGDRGPSRRTGDVRHSYIKAEQSLVGTTCANTNKWYLARTDVGTNALLGTSCHKRNLCSTKYMC